jgi:hypothetical protein
VILLAGTIAGKLPYRALWCEHHEDLLAEREDNLFDSFLLKTRQPERGHWKQRRSLSHVRGSVRGTG